MNKKPVIHQDIMELLKMLGLTIGVQTGGAFQAEYIKQTINKNCNGLYELKIDGKTIPFLTGHVFLNTVQLVENTLHYKLFS